MCPRDYYIKISVEPKPEIRLVGALLNTGQSFKAVSKTEYIITTKQARLLTKKKIPFKKVAPK